VVPVPRSAVPPKVESRFTVVATVRVEVPARVATTLTATLPVASSSTLAGSKLKLMVSGVSSLSVIDTVAVLVVPAVTPDGSVPKARSTDSPLSSRESSAAVNVKLLVVSSAPNVRLSGIPE